jgi:predicted phosphodiesterase
MKNENKRRKVRDLSQEEIGFIKAVLSQSPYLADCEIAETMLNANIAKDMSRKDLRNKIRYARREITGEKPSERTRVKNNKDGSISVIKSNTGMSDENADMYLDEYLLQDINLDPNEFELSSYGTSEWETANGETLHSERKKFVRKKEKDIDAEAMIASHFRKKILDACNGNVSEATKIIAKNDIEDIVASFYKKVCDTLPIDLPDNATKTLLLPQPDNHISEGCALNMVKSYKATYMNYIFPDIMSKYFVNDKLCVDKIDIPMLGDMMHFDNVNGTTTAGTQLHPKSKIGEAFTAALDYLEWLIITARKLFKVPVRLIYVYGNHDASLGCALVNALQRIFRDVEGVEFLINENLFTDPDDEWFIDSEDNPEYMWVKYGNIGITYTHGKFMKNNAKNIPEVANPNARRDAEYNVVIYGHLHHLNTANTEVNQHNFGLSTPNFVRDKFAKKLGCVTNPEFYVFEVNNATKRVSFTPYPSMPYNKQPEV